MGNVTYLLINLENMSFYHTHDSWYYGSVAHIFLPFVLKSRKFLDGDINSHDLKILYWVVVSIFLLVRLCPVFIHDNYNWSMNSIKIDDKIKFKKDENPVVNPSLLQDYYVTINQFNFYFSRMQVLYFVLFILLIFNIVYFQNNDMFSQGFVFLALYMEYYHSCLLSMCNTVNTIGKWHKQHPKSTISSLFESGLLYSIHI